MTKLFISYAHLDSKIVIPVTDDLRNSDYDVWIDTRGIQAGDLWVEEITEGISACDIFVLFISAQSVLSDYVRRELDLAFDARKRIIPVRLDASELPAKWKYQLAGIQYIDVKLADWQQRLMAALRSEQQLPPPVIKDTAPLAPRTDTGKLKNPYASLPLLEPLERELILSNRKEELKKATGQLDDHRLLVVTGMPGIGKSTFARALLDFRPDGSPIPFWYNFRHQQSSGNTLGILLERISGYLDFSLNAGIQQEVMAFRNSGGNASASDVEILISYLNQEKPIWLVFDNLETVLSRETGNFLDDGLDLLFDSLKNNMHNARIIITNPFVPMLKSGESLLEMGVPAISLQGLDTQSAVAFLRAFGLKNISDEKLEMVVGDSGGHPFILNQIAHYIQIFGITTALENLQGGLDEVNEKFGRSLKDRLSQQELGALQSLTVLNREVSLAGLCQIAQVKQGVIFRLREKGLLQTNDSGKFWLHNIVRNSLKLTDSDELQAMHLRAMNYFRSQTVPTLTKNIEDYTNVLEWHHHAVEAGDVVSAYAALYASGLEAHLMKWNEHDLLLRICEQTLNIPQKEQSRLSNVEHVRLQRTLGTVSFYSGDFTESITYLKTAVSLLPPDDERELRITLLIELSESYNANRDFDLAMKNCNQAISLVSTLQNDNLKAKVSQLRGIIYRDRGHLEQAITDLKDALRLYQKLMDYLHIVNATVDLGIVYYRSNQFAEAIENYQQVINLCETIGDTRGMMIARFNIGNIYLQDGRFQEALLELQAALDTARQMKVTWMEVWAGLDVVESFLGLLELDKAENELKALSPIIQKQASDCYSGQELALLAKLHWQRKQVDGARDYFKRAFRLFEGADCQEQKGRACLAFAQFLQEQGAYEQARDALLKGRRIFLEINNELGLKAVETTAKSIET